MKANTSRNKKKNISKLVMALIDVLLVILILLVIVYVTLNLFMPVKAMDVFKFRLYTIQTGSMEPVLPVGSLVIVKQARLSDLKEGDIITVYADVNLDGKKDVITHFFAGTKIEDGVTYILTKREAAVFYDSWKVKESDLIGTYVFHIGHIGKFADFMRSSFGISTILVNLLIIVIANSLIDRYCDDGMCNLMLPKPESDEE